MWLLDSLYHRRKEIGNLSPSDDKEWLLKYKPKVDEFFSDKIYMC